MTIEQVCVKGCLTLLFLQYVPSDKPYRLLFDQNRLCASVRQLVCYYMSTTFTVTVALHHQAWSGPDTRWWLSPRTGTCFVSTSFLELQVHPSSTGSGGLWTTCILFCHLNMFEEANRLWNMNICFSYRYNQDLKAQEKQKAWRSFSVASWNRDFILGTTLPLHLHIIPSCLHNIHAITIILPPLAWRPCWNLVHLKFLISSGCYQNLRTF